MVEMILQNSLGAKSSALNVSQNLCWYECLAIVPSAGDLGQPGARDVALAASFITARKNSGVMFVNTAAMCA